MSPISTSPVEQKERPRYDQPTGANEHLVVAHDLASSAPGQIRKQTRRSIQIERRATGNRNHRMGSANQEQSTARLATAVMPALASIQPKGKSKTEDELAANLSTGSCSDNVCAGCLKPIRERYLLAALDKRWHEDCLKCACCDCRLGEVGSSLFTHSDKILCRRDFLRIFGQQGQCAACKKTIPPYELVMRSNDLAYHMDCFACQQCQYRFCVGDRYHLSEHHRIVCLLCHADSTFPQALERRLEAGERHSSLPVPPDANQEPT